MSFNGATTFQPWILENAWELIDTRLQVSMGPRLFSRGYAREKEIGRDGEEGFNGATTFQPWIPALEGSCPNKNLGFNGATTFQPWIHEIYARKGSASKHLFQWGHDFSAVDTDADIAQTVLGSMVSMGPRLFSRGYFTGANLTDADLSSFNGATTFQPWIR